MPTYRVLYVPRPGVRLLIEDVEADALVQTPLHWALTRDALVVGRPREIVALRVARRDVTAVLRLCAVSARCPRDGAGCGCRPHPMVPIPTYGATGDEIVPI